MKITHISRSYVLVRAETREGRIGSIDLPEGVLNVERVTENAGTIVGMADEFIPKDRPKAKPLKEIPFKVGDRVVFRNYLKDLYQVEVEGETLFFLHFEDILGVVPEDVKVGRYYHAEAV